MKNRTIIGKVSATEKCPSTIDEFYFWTDKKQILSPFDIIKVEHEHSSITYGVIEEINHVTDADSRWANHLYPVFLTEKYCKSNYIDNNIILNLF